MATKSKKKQSDKWFIRVRGSYLPNNKYGWLTYIPYVGYTAGAFVYVMVQRYDFVLSCLLLVPNWIAAAAVMNALARKYS